MTTTRTPFARLIRLALMALLLLFSQQQLLAHELSHGIQGKHERQEQAPGQHACEKCLSLAPFSGAVASTPPLLHLACGQEALPVEPHPVSLAPRAGRSRSRGPPPLL